MTAYLPPINRSRFAQAMGVATVCAAALGGALAMRPENASSDATMVVVALIVFSVVPSVVAMLGPSLIPDDVWGLAVMGTSALRTMLAMGAMMLLTEIAGMPREPVVHGLLGGALALTLAEAAAAVWQLQRREIARTNTSAQTVPDQRSL